MPHDKNRLENIFVHIILSIHFYYSTKLYTLSTPSPVVKLASSFSAGSWSGSRPLFLQANRFASWFPTVYSPCARCSGATPTPSSTSSKSWRTWHLRNIQGICTSFTHVVSRCFRYFVAPRRGGYTKGRGRVRGNTEIFDWHAMQFVYLDNPLDRRWMPENWTCVDSSRSRG